MLSFSVVSCAVDEISDYSTLADIAFLTSISDDNNHEYIYKSTETHLSIMDASQGTISHKWVVPEGVGIHLLKGDPIDEASSDIVWSDYIDPTIPYINDVDCLHMYFDDTSATYDGEPVIVKLVNTYKQPVVYNYLVDHDGSTAASIESVEENGVHVLTIPFSIQIYDKTMKPSAKFYSDAAMTQEYAAEEVNGIPTIDVTIGQTVYFKDTSTDRPNIWTWGITVPSTSTLSKYAAETQDTEYTFTAAGSYTVSLGAQRAAEGLDYYSGDIPTASKVTVSSLLKVNVADEPPIDPVVKSVEFNPSTKNIEIAVDNAMFDTSTLSANAGLFYISYTNANTGKSGNIDVYSVAIKVDDAGTSEDDSDDTAVYNTIVLTLAERVYTDDVITVNYTRKADNATGVCYAGGDGNMGTKVELTLEDAVVTVMEEVLFSYDFEDCELGSSDGWILRKIVGSSSGSSNSAGEVYDSKPEVYTNPDYGTSSVNTSSKCLYMNLNKARRQSEYADACLTDDDYTRVFTPIEDAGVTYRVRFKYRYDEGATSAYTIGAQISVYSAWNLTTAASYGKELATTASSTNGGYVYTTNENTWIQFDETIAMTGTIPTSTTYPNWAPYMLFTTGWNARVWIDDFEAYIYEARPEE